MGRSKAASKSDDQQEATASMELDVNVVKTSKKKMTSTSEKKKKTPSKNTESSSKSSLNKKNKKTQSNDKKQKSSASSSSSKNGNAKTSKKKSLSSDKTGDAKNKESLEKKSGSKMSRKRKTSEPDSSGNSESEEEELNATSNEKADAHSLIKSVTKSRSMGDPGENLSPIKNMGYGDPRSVWLGDGIDAAMNGLNRMDSRITSSSSKSGSSQGDIELNDRSKIVINSIMNDMTDMLGKNAVAFTSHNGFTNVSVKQILSSSRCVLTQRMLDSCLSVPCIKGEVDSAYSHRKTKKNVQKDESTAVSQNGSATSDNANDNDDNESIDESEHDEMDQ